MVNLDKYASVEQGSDAWHAIRNGKFTGSEVHRLMATETRPMTEQELIDYKKANPGSRVTTIADPYLLAKGARTYVEEVASERITGMPAKELFENDSMRWGKEHEPNAKKLLSLAHDMNGRNVAFIDYEDYAGMSPDWIVVVPGFGVEIKCPINRAIHLKYRTLQNADDLKMNHPDHYWQCAKGMLTTGYKFWKFVSYHPHYPPLMQLKIINVPRFEPDIELLKLKLSVANRAANYLLTV